jgi:hypothetical protein
MAPTPPTKDHFEVLEDKLQPDINTARGIAGLLNNAFSNFEINNKLQDRDYKVTDTQKDALYKNIVGVLDKYLLDSGIAPNQKKLEDHRDLYFRGFFGMTSAEIRSEISQHSRIDFAAFMQSISNPIMQRHILPKVNAYVAEKVTEKNYATVKAEYKDILKKMKIDAPDDIAWSNPDQIRAVITNVYVGKHLRGGKYELLNQEYRTK